MNRIQEYKFVVTAQDKGPDPRLATAIVTIHVIDVEDEVPIFHQSTYEASVKENIPNYMVTQVMVSKFIKNAETIVFTCYPFCE